MEGLEVPVIGAQVSAAVGTAAAANIQIIATDRALEIHPRTLVHLFFFDLEHNVGGFDQARVTEGVSLLPSYRLLFHGEVIGLQFVQTPSSRAIVLQCMDTSCHWDTTYQFMLDVAGGGQNSLIDNNAKFLGAEGYRFDNTAGGANSPEMVISALLQESPQTSALQGVTGLLAGIVRILESVGGVADQQIGMNDYETVAELRLKNLFQIAAEEGDDSAKQLFEDEVFTSWIKGTLAQRGGLISVRDMINLLNSFIYYDVVPNPVARYLQATAYVPAKSFSGIGKVEELAEGTWKHPSALSFSEAGRKKLKAEEGSRQFVYDDLTGKPVSSFEGLEGKPTIGIGHLITMPEQTSGKFNAHLRDAPGGRGMTDAEVLALFEEDSESRDATIRGKLGATPTTQNQFDALFSFYYNAGNHATFTRSVRMHNQKRYTTAARSIRSGVNTSNKVVVAALVRRRSHEADQYLSDTVLAPAKPKEGEPATPTGDADPKPKVIGEGDMTPAQKRQHARLLTQIFRPDVWFVAPPRCNTFFPEMYTRLTYQRNFMREITRYQLRSHMKIIGVGATPGLTDTFYYAPVTDQFKNALLAQGEKGELRESLILEHETYVGIIPKIDRLPDIHFWSTQEQVIARASRGLGSKPDEYASATAGFNFFRERFAARSMEISGYFNPYPVVGFPSIVLRRGMAPIPGVPMDDLISAVRTREVPLPLTGHSETYAPSQLIGMITSLNHSLDQTGGSTSASFSHVRTHMGADGADDEYLRLQQARGNVVGDAFKTLTTFDARELVAAGDFTALGWIRKSTPQLSTASDGTTTVPAAHADETGSFLGSNTRDGPKGGKIVEIKTSGQFLKYDRAAKKIKGSILEGANAASTSSYQLLYTTVQIYEEKPYTDAEKDALKAVKVTTPFEVSIFPAWFSEKYYNDNIGTEIYGKWFGTGSVVEQQSIAFREELSGGRTRETTLANVDASSSISPTAPSPTTETPVQKARRKEISIKQELSVAEAVDVLAILYGSVRASSDLDANRFVQNYIYRPVATLNEMLGSDDLQFDQGSGQPSDGWEGFSSRAILSLDGLKGLLTDPDAPLPSVTAGVDPRGVDKTIDPRVGRTLRVLRYLGDLVSQRGLPG